MEKPDCVVVVMGASTRGEAPAPVAGNKNFESIKTVMLNCQPPPGDTARLFKFKRKTSGWDSNMAACSAASCGDLELPRSVIWLVGTLKVSFVK